VSVDSPAAKRFRVFGRALVIRHVDAGSCNGCELEIHALNGAHYKLEGLSTRFAASPRPADRLLATASRRACEAMPDPRWVVAMGECAADGGVLGESYASCGRVARVIPVDVVVPGCPPDPLAPLRGIRPAVSR